MKIIITLLLVLTASESFASPAKVLSQVCGHKYVEGVRKERPNGQVVRECLNKRSLPKEYEADIGSRCASEYIEGDWRFSSNGFHYKSCIHESILDNIYITYEKNSCTKGYSSDEVISYFAFDFSYKVCVRD
jgi:hypothetical protein